MTGGSRSRCDAAQTVVEKQLRPRQTKGRGLYRLGNDDLKFSPARKMTGERNLDSVLFKIADLRDSRVGAPAAKPPFLATKVATGESGIIRLVPPPPPEPRPQPTQALTVVSTPPSLVSLDFDIPISTEDGDSEPSRDLRNAPLRHPQRTAMTATIVIAILTLVGFAAAILTAS